MLDVVIDKKVFHAADRSQLVAIDGLRLSVSDGEFVCLVGPSGCGKTTTLRIILGLDRDFVGQVQRSPARGRIGAVFQEPTLLPWRSVEQNVRLAMPKERRDDDLNELFAVLGLEELRGYYPGELSLGLARRVALARAFAVKPDLLLLDEPFVSLDEQTATRLRDLLVTIWRQYKVSTLMVTHNLREAAMLADRIVFLSARPAHVSASFDIALPRNRRNDEEIAGLLVEIGKAVPQAL